MVLNMAIEIVDLPSYKMVIFHSYVNVYQRVELSTLYTGVLLDYTMANIRKYAHIILQQSSKFTLR